MLLTPIQTLIMILAVMLGTQLTRWIPFLLFPEKRDIPRVVSDLGRMLPAAMMGLLVVYCFKSVSFTSSPYGIPELIASAVVVIMHLWRGNTLLSIGSGTVLYMLLVQFVF